MRIKFLLPIIALLATCFSLWAWWKSAYDLNSNLREMAAFAIAIPIVVIIIALFKLFFFLRKPFIPRIAYFVASILALFLPSVLFFSLPLPIKSDGFEERMNNYNELQFRSFLNEIRRQTDEIEPNFANFDWWKHIDRQVLAQDYPFVDLGSHPPKLNVQANKIHLRWQVFLYAYELHVWDDPAKTRYQRNKGDEINEIYPGILVLTIDY